jgi:hypothetical protein
MRDVRVIFTAPLRLLVLLNAVASAGAFVVALVWAVFYLNSGAAYIIAMLAVAGFLSLVAFVGERWTSASDEAAVDEIVSPRPT